MTSSRRRRRCLLVLAQRAPGRDIVTIEGLSQGGALHPDPAPRSSSMAERQCDFCTPGIVLSARLCSTAIPKSDGANVRRTTIAGNICRCTGYDEIVQCTIIAAAALQVRDWAVVRSPRDEPP